MKRETDDMENRRLQQENISKPFPYVFPKMPPRFRRCCSFAKAVFLIQWGCFAVFCFGSMVMFVPVIVFDNLSAMAADKPFLAFFISVIAVSFKLSFLAVPLGFTPKLFWKCPCCGCPFPYYAPARGDRLKEKESLLMLKELHIKYAKRKFCPLIIPSVCPECRCKFFEMPDGYGSSA